MPPETAKLLFDLSSAARHVRAFIEGKTFGDYRCDEMLRSAVERKCITLGEKMRQLCKRDPAAAARLTDHRPIVALGDDLNYRYDSTDDVLTWDVVIHQLPTLQVEVDRLLAQPVADEPDTFNARTSDMPNQFRTERDSMGEMQVPADAYYGAQTARAVENFPISDLRFSRRFIAAMGLIKWAAAQVNFELGVLNEQRRALLQQAAQEVVDGKLDAQFVVDIFQTGSGTSTNMNTNEVIATRANEIATGKRGGKDPVHPNDHVNQQQSSNDVIPTAMHVSAAVAIKESLKPALEHLAEVLDKKAKQYDDLVKIGRTHLQDATPIRVGQELGGYAHQARLSAMRAEKAMRALRELPLGGTAVGTGINSHPDFAKRAVAVIAQRSGVEFVEAENHFEAQAAKDGVVEASGQLKTIAVSLSKIANDVRWLASGPRCGIGELSIPATQPGSSIMPGKVNPVMSEMALMVAAQVVGNDATIAFAGSGLGSTFELNVMMPVMAYNLLQSIELLAKAARVFADRCAAGIEADRERCESLVEQSLAMCTSLAPVIGYDKAADVAKESFKTGRTVRQVARDRKLMDDAALDKVLDAKRMTQPQADMIGSGGG